MNRFSFLRVLFSPFKLFGLKFYFGKVAIGVPYFYPRRWVKSEKPGYTKPVPKKIGFDFIGLGYKTKWSDTDYRFESNPVWSFVFFNLQIALMFVPEHDHNYWESWLYYDRNTDKTKSTKQRLEQLIKDFPQKHTIFKGNGVREKVDYYNLILKEKWKKDFKSQIG